MIEKWLNLTDIAFLCLITLYGFGTIIFISLREPYHRRNEAERIELIVRRLKNE